jgi:hypothetical protein
MAFRNEIFDFKVFFKLRVMNLNIRHIVVYDVGHIANHKSIHKSSAKDEGPNSNNNGAHYHKASASAAPNVSPSNF